MYLGTKKKTDDASSTPSKCHPEANLELSTRFVPWMRSSSPVSSGERLINAGKQGLIGLALVISGAFVLVASLCATNSGAITTILGGILIFLGMLLSTKAVLDVLEI